MIKKKLFIMVSKQMKIYAGIHHSGLVLCVSLEASKFNTTTKMY